MKKLIAFIMSIAFCFILSSCDTNKTTSVALAEPQGILETKISSHSLEKTLTDEDAVLIKLAFTNGMKKALNFKFNILVSVAQGDAVLAPIPLEENSKYIEESAYEKVEPNQTKEVTLAFKLNNVKDSIVVTVQPTSGDQRKAESFKLDLKKE